MQNHYVHPLYVDTLRVARIMAPRLKSYKLKSLLEIFGLDSEISYLADDGIIASKFVFDYFLGIFAANIQHIGCLRNNSAVAGLFRRAYADIYHDTFSRLYQRASESTMFVDELVLLYDTFIHKEWIASKLKMQHILSFLHIDAISPKKTPCSIELLFIFSFGITCLCYP